MSKFRAYLKIFQLCLISTSRINLGDYVTTTDGKRCYVSNGTLRPRWNLRLIADPAKEYLIHETNFRKERSLRNFIHDIRSTYRFWRGYWFDIWLNKGEFLGPLK